MKKYLILTLVLLTLSAGFGYSKGLISKHSNEHVYYSVEVQGEALKNIDTNLETISFKTGNHDYLNLSLYKSNGKAIPGYGTNVRYNKNKSKALAYDHSGEGFVVITPGGKVIEEFFEVFEQHKSKAVVEEGRIIANDPHWLNDNKIVYISNADSEVGYSSLWVLDLNDKVSKKILDSNSLNRSFYIGNVNEDFIQAVSLEDFQIYRINNTNFELDGIINTNGYIEDFSYNGKYVIQRELISGKMSSNIQIVDIETSEKHNVPLSKYSFNGMIQWSFDDSKVAFFAQENESLKDVIFVVNIESLNSIILEAPEGLVYDSTSFTWLDNTTIVANMGDGSSWEFRLVE